MLASRTASAHTLHPLATKELAEEIHAIHCVGFDRQAVEGKVRQYVGGNPITKCPGDEASIPDVQAYLRTIWCDQVARSGQGRVALSHISDRHIGIPAESDSRNAYLH